MHHALSCSPLPEYPPHFIHFIHLVDSFLNFKNQLRLYSPPGSFPSPHPTLAELAVPTFSSLNSLCPYHPWYIALSYLVYKSVISTGL